MKRVARTASQTRTTTYLSFTDSLRSGQLESDLAQIIYTMVEECLYPWNVTVDRIYPFTLWTFTRGSPFSCRLRSFSCLLLVAAGFSEPSSELPVDPLPAKIGPITEVHSLKIA